MTGRHEVRLLLPTDCKMSISGTINGRCAMYFAELRTDDAMKFLALFVECEKAERHRQAAATDDDTWEWAES